MFTQEFTQFHQDSIVHNVNKKTNRFVIHNSKKKEFLVYDYTNTSFKKYALHNVPFPVDYFFSVGDLLVTYFKKYNVYNINHNFGKIISEHVFEPLEGNTPPSVVFLTNRFWKSDSFLVYSFADEHGDPIYLEDCQKKLPLYIPKDTDHAPGKFSDVKFSSTVLKSQITIPFIAGISKKENDYLLEFKNIFNERSTNKSVRDKYRSTKDPYPIEIKSSTLPQLTSNDGSFYYSADEVLYKIRIPSVNDLVLLFEKDGLIKASKKLEEMKMKKEIVNEDVFRSTFVRQSLSMQDSKMIQSTLTSMYTPSTSPRTLGKEIFESPRSFGKELFEESPRKYQSAESPRKLHVLESPRKLSLFDQKKTKESPTSFLGESPKKFSYFNDEDLKKFHESISPKESVSPLSTPIEEPKEQRMTFRALVRSLTKVKENKEKKEENSKRLKKKVSILGNSTSLWSAHGTASASPTKYSSVNSGDTEESNIEDLAKLKQKKEEKSKSKIIIEKPDVVIKFNKIEIPVRREESASDEKRPKTPKTPKGMEFLLSPRTDSPVVGFDELASEFSIGRMIETFTGENSNELSVPRDELVIIVEEENIDKNCWRLCFYKEMEGYIPASFMELIDFKSFQKRKDIVKEFLSTERTYVKNLNHLNNHFVVPLENGIISEETHRKLFSSLKIVLGINVLFLNKLQQIAKKDYVSQDFELSSLLLEYSQAFKLYTDYIVGYDLSSDILRKEKETNSKFEKFLKEKQQELKEKGLLVDIQSYLVLPVQRLPRYRMLLEDLLRVPETLFLIYLEHTNERKSEKIQSINFGVGRNF